MEHPPRYALVVQGLFVGNESSAKNAQILKNNQIKSILNLTGQSIQAPGVTVHDYMLPRQNMTDAEMPKTIMKLEEITKKLREIESRGPILISCEDGKNSCMLAAGYYLITIGNTAGDITNKLETLYMTPEQATDHLVEAKRMLTMSQTGVEIKCTTEQFMEREKKKREREDFRSLTMVSFKKLLLMPRKK